jgi:phenylpyruvate tautomerase PptA (4-oxalocrotonate tautomerase family)
MASERVLEVLVRRHVINSERPFSTVLDGVFEGISQPDIGMLFGELAASTSYEQFSSLVRQAQGSAGLMRFLQLDLDPVLTLDPQAPDWAGRRLVRLIAGNPVTMGQMTRHVADAGSYAPVTILIQEMPDGGTRISYDTVASAIAPYHDTTASQVAERLDTEVLGLLRQVTGVPASATARDARATALIRTKEHDHPMIDVYATAGTFADTHRLAADLAAALMTIEQVPDIPMFRQNTAAFIHDLPAGRLSNVDGEGNYVRIQVLTNAGALDRAKQLAVVERLTSIAADAVGDPTLTSRTWVLLTEAPDGAGAWPATPTPTRNWSRPPGRR